MTSELLGVHLGRAMCTDRYDVLGKAMWDQLPQAQPPSQAAVLASIGWTGLGYRARAAIEHLDSFRTLFGREPAASHEERYQQDNHFFGFVTNVAAGAESLVFAVHAFVAGNTGVELTPALLKQTRTQMIAFVGRQPPFSSLARTLGQQLDAARSLFDLRDMLLHRGRPPRNQFVGGKFDGKQTLASNPKALPDNWENTFVFNAHSCDPWEAWFRRLVESSFAELELALNLV